MDFIGHFKKFAYGNTYIYNLLDHFLWYMYPHPTFGAHTNNIIILFDYYFQANPKLYTVYIDTGFYFTSQKLRTYFQKKDIAVVFVPSVSYKSIGMIKRSNDILQQVFNKKCEPKKEWKVALFYAISQVNSWIIEHLGYSPVKIITGIQLHTFIKCKIWINSVPTKLKVPIEELIFPLIWDYMGCKIDIRENVYNWSVRMKE